MASEDKDARNVGREEMGAYTENHVIHSSAHARRAKMQWEYKTIKLAAKGFFGGKLDEAKLDSFMNQLGTEGWELVAGFDTNQSYGATRDVVVMFKRPKQ